MNRVAFVFASAPHGTASGREGLDALLAASTLTEDIGVFFISDGVFQLLVGQKPKMVLMRDYIATFKVLPLYGIKKLLVCSASLEMRGLTENAEMILDTIVVSPNVLREELDSYDIVLNF